MARWRGSKIRRNEKVLAERRSEQVASIIQKAQAQAQPKPDEKKNDTVVRLPYRLLPRQWSELKVPSGLSELEKLTYVPGLVGDIIEWIVRTAPRPNRMLALGVALTVVGTIIGRKVKTPGNESATHLYIIILGRTTLGKGHPIRSGIRLLELLELGHLIGPGAFASGPGFEEELVYHPLIICFIDEPGDEFSKLKAQRGNEWVSSLKGVLKKAWDPWNSWKTASKVGTEKAQIKWPAVSIVGASTWRSYFDAVQGGDFESGFANRWLILPEPYDGKRPLEQVDVRADPPPDELLKALLELPQARTAVVERKIGDLSSVAGAVSLPERVDVGWSDEARELYREFSARIDALEGNHPRAELALRSAENAKRCATIVSQGCFRDVDKSDMDWGTRFAEESFKAHAGGADRFLREYHEFPEMCDRLHAAYLAAPNHFISDRDANRRFGRNQRYGNELERAQRQLAKEKRLDRCEMSPTGFGRAAKGYRALVDETDDGSEEEKCGL